MTQAELDKIIEAHKKWIESAGEKGKKADLRWANLKGANLEGANLKWAKLEGTNLEGATLRGTNLECATLRGTTIRGANLRGASLDFASFFLSCNTFDIKVCQRLPFQLAYHICRMKSDDNHVLEMQELLKGFANKSHVINEHGLPNIL